MPDRGFYSGSPSAAATVQACASLPPMSSCYKDIRYQEKTVKSGHPGRDRNPRINPMQSNWLCKSASDAERPMPDARGNVPGSTEGE
jgi:hypothetical protein